MPQIMADAVYLPPSTPRPAIRSTSGATLTGVVPLDVDMYMANMMQVYDDALYLSLSNRVALCLPAATPPPTSTATYRGLWPNCRPSATAFT
ncbi:MAG: hypothetical protein U0X20_02060 [Caldilineaceae bacterium]